MKYLYSRKNFVGLALALVGLVLVFAHVIGAFWPLIVIGLYLVGALITPGHSSRDLRADFRPNDVRHALDSQVFAVGGRVPPDVMAKVQSIRQIINGILPRSGNLPPGSPELYIIERTATMRRLIAAAGQIAFVKTAPAYFGTRASCQRKHQHAEWNESSEKIFHNCVFDS